MGDISSVDNKVFRWRIDDFSYDVRDPESDIPFHPSVQYGGFNWHLRLSARMVGSPYGYLGLFLVLDHASSLPSDLVIHAVFNLRAYHQLNERFLDFKVDGYFGNKHDAWGIDNFVFLIKFQDSERGMLLNDSCIFGIEFLELNTSKVSCITRSKCPAHKSFFENNAAGGHMGQEEWKMCSCPARCPLRTDWTVENAGRRFWSCPNFKDQRCDFFVWEDEPFPEQARKTIIQLLENSTKSALESVKLKEENLLLKYGGLTSLEIMLKEREERIKGREEKVRTIKEATKRREENLFMFTLLLLLVSCIFPRFLGP